MAFDFSIEVVNLITQYLTTKEKLNLMKTCRKLNDIISNSNLFEHVVLNEPNEQTLDMILHFIEHAHYGKLVKRLVVNLTGLPSQIFRILPGIFPNVQEFLNTGFDVERTNADVQPFMLWKDTLTRYDSDGGYRPIVRFLEMTKFSKLTYLAISPFIGDATKVDEYEIDIFECFKNAPALKQLKLSRCEISLSFMEKMHRLCPNLSKLTVNEVVFLAKLDDVLPQKIEPATLFEYLDLSGSVSMLDKKCLFLEYFLQKYPNLKTLDIITPYYKSDMGVAIEILYSHECMEEYLRSRTNRNNQQDEDQDQEEDDDDEDEEGGFYESKQAELREAYQACLSEGSFFLNKLPSTLKKLTLDPSIFTNIMEELDQAKLNLTELCFYDQDEYTNIIKGPNDLFYFKNMTSLKRLEIVFGSNIQEYSDGVVSDSITELKVRIDPITSHDEMDLAWILSSFPSLRKLDIDKSGVSLVARKPKRGELYPDLYKLRLFRCYIDPTVNRYLSAVAPNLLAVAWSILSRRLMEEECRATRLEKPDYPKTEIKPNQHDIIDLSGRDLLEFHLSTVLDDNSLTKRRDCLLEIMTSKGSKRFIYTDSFINGPKVEMEITDKNELSPATEKNMRKITLKCTHVKLFNINGMTAVKLE